MVQLPAVNTPPFDWARSRRLRRLEPVPPIYQPEAIARYVYRAAHTAPRERWIGFPTWKAIIGTMIAPGRIDGDLARRGSLLLCRIVYFPKAGNHLSGRCSITAR